MNNTFHNLFKTFLILAALALCIPGTAQKMPDDIFDTLPPAFGDSLNDVPPDILSVVTSPLKPEAGNPTTVTARIETDHVMTIFRVADASLIYEIDGIVTKTEMSKSQSDQRLWTAEIPEQKKGAIVHFGIVAHDETGNAVAQLLVRKGVETNDYIKVITDKEDSELLPSLDIKNVSFTTDGDKMYYCQTFHAPFQPATTAGASISAVGFYPHDVREIPTHSVSEHTHAFIAYIPFANKIGIMNVENFQSIEADKAGVSIKQQGKKVCGSAPINKLTVKPEKGLKMFAASASFDLSKSILYLADSSPYAIIYFKDNSFKIE